MLLNDRGNIFVGQRIDVNEEAWQMPQRGLEEGETPREAALRELQEELGTCKAEIIAETKTWFRYDLPAEFLDGSAMAAGGVSSRSGFSCSSAGKIRTSISQQRIPNFRNGNG
jgi:8-oxo-dGTP pyrophosphatase MutT (NUDIX family)